MVSGSQNDRFPESVPCIFFLILKDGLSLSLIFNPIYFLLNLRGLVVLNVITYVVVLIKGYVL